MLREVLEGKSSLNVARRIYLNDLKLGVYVPRRMMLPQRKKKRFIDTDDSMLYPREKLERMQKYTKSLGSRKAKAKEQAGVEKRSPFSTFDPCANRLETLFSVFGKVEKAYIVKDCNTGESKGFGFVVMSSDEEALAAIAALDGKKCGAFTVRVSEAKGKG